MKKSIILSAIFFTFCNVLCIFSCIAQLPDCVWAKCIGGKSSDNVKSVAFDASGNMYMAGSFGSDSITFGSLTLINDSISVGNCAGTDDMYIVKLDKWGNVLWAKRAGGKGFELLKAMGADDMGNTYISGIFDSNSISFGAFTLKKSMGSNFLVKYDTDGKVLWAKNNPGGALAVDASGFLYVTGTFKGATITIGYFALNNSDSTGNTSDVFLSKYDTNGNVLWAKSSGGSNMDYENSLALDALGNVYLVGSFRSPVMHFGPIALTNMGMENIFLAKYDKKGKILWAKGAGGERSDKPNSVSVDVSGNIYMAGNIESRTINFDSITIKGIEKDPKSYMHVTDIFLAKYNTDGKVIWARSAGGDKGNASANSIAIDASGNAYLFGSFRSRKFTIDSTTLTNTVPNDDDFLIEPDVFLAKYNNSGNVLWAISAGEKRVRGGYIQGSATECATSVVLDASENIILAGTFSSDEFPLGSLTLKNKGNYDIYISKFTKGSMNK